MSQALLRRIPRAVRRQLIAAGCGFAILSTAGCVYRSLTIRTDPPGALVYVNDQLKGESPVTYDFMWYGTHRVTLRKDGFERLDDQKLLRAPVYFWIPFDLAFELIPFRMHDIREWSYTLTPSPTLPSPVPPTLPMPPGLSEPSSAPRTVEEQGPSSPGTEKTPPRPAEPADETR